MISRVEPFHGVAEGGLPGERERLLVVTPRSRYEPIIEFLHRQFPDRWITQQESYLAAIADLVRRPARTVVAGVDPSLPRLADAVAGLREAAGLDTKLVLCCPPEYEPAARDSLAHGADDYVLIPLEESELDRALGITRTTDAADAEAAGPEIPPAELAGIAEALAHLSDDARDLYARLALIVQQALRARNATLVVEGAVAQAGTIASAPVLTVPIVAGTRRLGQLSVGVRLEGAFGPADMTRLEHYAALIGRFVLAARTLRDLCHQARTDPGSGLPNRRYLLEHLRETLEEAKSRRLPVTLLLFDVDDLKSYNDRFGHATGDEIIRVVGRLFRDHCRRRDIVARYGGDEFAVVFYDPDGPRAPGAPQLQCALDILERFQQALGRQHLASVPPEHEVRLSVSGGLATFPWDAANMDELIAKADEALLSAKRAGKNRILTLSGASSPDGT